MRKTAALLNLTLMVCAGAHLGVARTAGGLRGIPRLVPARPWNALQQAAGQKLTTWSGRDEYDAFQLMATEKDPAKRISLAEAFLQKWPNSFMKSTAYVAISQAYQQLRDAVKMYDAAGKGVEANPDNVDAIYFASVALPYAFKATDPDATTKLSRSESDARHGLEVLQKLQKPASLTDEQFTRYVRGLRSTFNSTVGFVALQRKDYPAAASAFRAGAEDNPADFTTFYRLGLAYWYSSPPDYNHAVWYLARALSLARAAQDPFEAEVTKDLNRLYLNYHGTADGLSDIITQSAASPDPPEAFKVTPMEKPKLTGNPTVDGFNEMTFPLRMAGDRAQKQWEALKGQTIKDMAGVVESVDKGTDPGTFVVKIDVLDQSKAVDGVYDIELKDSTQPNVKNLSKGELVIFKGSLENYTPTPNMVLTLAGEITKPDPLPDKPAAKEKAKPKPKAPPARRPARRRPG